MLTQMAQNPIQQMWPYVHTTYRHSTALGVKCCTTFQSQCSKMHSPEAMLRLKGKNLIMAGSPPQTQLGRHRAVIPRGHHTRLSPVTRSATDRFKNVGLTTTLTLNLAVADRKTGESWEWLPLGMAAQNHYGTYSHSPDPLVGWEGGTSPPHSPPLDSLGVTTSAPAVLLSTMSCTTFWNVSTHP